MGLSMALFYGKLYVDSPRDCLDSSLREELEEELVLFIAASGIGESEAGRVFKRKFCLESSLRFGPIGSMLSLSMGTAVWRTKV